VDLGINGRSCVVTGASRGIGRDVAGRLCEAGASVLLVARGEEALTAAVAQCAAGSGRAESLAIDVTRPDAAEVIAEHARRELGSLDVVVNNAGQATWRDSLAEVDDADWQSAWELNVMAPMRLMREATPGMRERGWGRVVNVSSTAGKRPSARIPEYSVAKAALLSLSRLYADECAADGVLVNAVCPGGTASEMWMEEGGLLDQLRESAGHSSRKDALAAAVGTRPIPRMAEPAEIGAVIAFLCSEQASYVTGAAWSVDGGTVQSIV
jgi:3-oxoacyl-[acyl-carrier protein] reductase